MNISALKNDALNNIIELYSIGTPLNFIASEINGKYSLNLNQREIEKYIKQTLDRF